MAGWVVLAVFWALWASVAIWIVGREIDQFGERVAALGARIAALEIAALKADKEEN